MLPVPHRNWRNIFIFLAKTVCFVWLCTAIPPILVLHLCSSNHTETEETSSSFCQQTACFVWLCNLIWSFHCPSASGIDCAWQALVAIHQLTTRASVAVLAVVILCLFQYYCRRNETKLPCCVLFDRSIQRPWTHSLTCSCLGCRCFAAIFPFLSELLKVRSSSTGCSWSTPLLRGLMPCWSPCSLSKIRFALVQ